MHICMHVLNQICHKFELLNLACVNMLKEWTSGEKYYVDFIF